MKGSCAWTQFGQRLHVKVHAANVHGRRAPLYGNTFKGFKSRERLVCMESRIRVDSVSRQRAQSVIQCSKVFASLGGSMVCAESVNVTRTFEYADVKKMPNVKKYIK